MDRLALLLVVLVACAVRLAFLDRAPLFIRPDSVPYFQAGYDLAYGRGPDLQLYRVAGYPLFLAATIRLLGEDLRTIAIVQHALGVLTAALAYLLGREAFGRLAGLVAGLLVGLSAPLLIHEHSLMAETLFTVLLLLAFLLLARALRAGSGPLMLGAGLVLGLAFQTRPVGLVVLPALWVGLLVQSGDWRRRLGQIGLLSIGFLGLAAPLFILNQVRAGEGGGPALGTFLYDRVARHDTPPALPRASSPAPTTDPRQVTARRTLIKLIERKASRKIVDRDLRQRLGLSDAEANRAMRDVALEVIRYQPEWYIRRTLENVGGILLGEVERLQFHASSRDRRDVRDAWLAQPRIAHLLEPTTDDQRRELPTAEALARVFQPAQHRVLLGVAIALGLAWGLVRSPYRVSVALALAALALVVAGAALVGDVPRYRYPADPLLAVLAGGGVGTTLALTGARLGRLRRGRAALALPRAMRYT